MCASNLYWGHFFDSLGDAHRLLVPDLLGFGRSPKPAIGYSAQAHAAALADSLQECGIHEPVLVAGHSMGTIAGLALARYHPELVAAVVAIAPPIYRTRADARRHVRAMGPVEGMMAFDPPAKLVCRAMCAHRELAARLAPLLRPDLPVPIARDVVQHIWTSYSESMEELILESHAPDWLSAIDVPVHLFAALDDPVTDIRFLNELTAAHQNVALTLWPDGGHDLPLSRREQCLAAVESMAREMRGRSPRIAATTARDKVVPTVGESAF